MAAMHAGFGFGFGLASHTTQITRHGHKSVLDSERESQQSTFRKPVDVQFQSSMVCGDK